MAIYILNADNMAQVSPQAQALLIDCGSTQEFIERFAILGQEEQAKSILASSENAGVISTVDPDEACRRLFKLAHEAHRLMKGLCTTEWLPDEVTDLKEYRSYARAARLFNLVTFLGDRTDKPDPVGDLVFYGQEADAGEADESLES